MNKVKQMRGTATIPKPEHGTLPWLQVRHCDPAGRVRFGASEAPILMGVSKFKNVVDLAIEKWSEPEVKEQTEAMTRGHLLEPAVLAYASQLMGEEITTPEEMFICERFIATLDGLNPSGSVIVEAKTTTFYSSDDPLPVEYYWQVLAQLACYPTAEQAVIVVLDKRMRFGHWVVRRQDVLEDIDALLFRAEDVGQMLDNKELPTDVQPTEDQVKALYPSPAGEVELSADEYRLVEEWLASQQAEKMAKETEQAYRNKVTAMLADKEYGTYSGARVVSFKARKASIRLDTKGLERDFPDLVEKYRVAGQGTRVLKGML